MSLSHRALLLETTSTILQMARIARSQDAKLENKIFYSHLASYCMRIKCHAASCTETAVDPHGGLISQTLGHLGMLFPEVCRYGASTAGFMSFVQDHLTAINLAWNEIYRHNEDAKHEFIHQWLQSAMPTPQRLALELALESCADEFEKQQAEPKESLSLSLFKSSTHNEPSYTVHKAAHSIFNALRSCNRCACSCQHSFDAKLELGTYRKPKNAPKKRTPFRTRPKPNATEDENVDVDFDMFLSTDQDWHEIRIQAVKNKTVSFAPVGNADSTMPPHEHSSSSNSVGKIDTLCMPIHKKKDKRWQRLILKMNKEELFEKGFEKSNFQVDSSVEPISLAQCLTEHREYFTEKTRRILSLILGYTVLHLHGTPWLAPGWDSTSVKFFQTTSSKTPLRPFIQTKLPTNNPTSDLEIHICDTNTSLSDVWCELDMRHCCPVVIALAVMLLEIHFARPFTELAKKYNVELTSLPGAPISPLDLHQVFNGDEEEGQLGAKSEIPEDSALVKAIENCLDDSLWEDESGQPLDNATLRSRIYQEIVSLLELHLTKGFSQIPLDSIDQCARDLDFGKWGLNVAGRENTNEGRQSLVPATPVPNLPLPANYSLSVASAAATSTAQTLWNTVYLYQGAPNPIQYAISNPGSLPIPEYDYRESHFFDDQIAVASTADTTQYLSWKDEYMKVYEKFISKELDSHPTGVIKVAILDTGIDRNHDLIEGREENIRGKHNLYDPPRKTIKDENGHGTFITSLILDYAPDVELYIIKITGKKNATPAGNVVAQAIQYAVDEWDVDIISMSFGWPSEDFDGFELVDEAIDAAYSNKVLMFAAGSNSGGKTGRAYPASSPHVICVHSTNTYGSASDFSPTAEHNAVNLATVGESVQSAWPSAPDGIASRSGTSYATPIMVGIAAFLLQYARIHCSAKVARSLKRRDKMEALLQRVAMRAHTRNDRQRDDYFYVQLSLQKHNLFGQTLEYINGEIEMAISA